MALNIGLPFNFSPTRVPDFLADQGTSLANQKLQAELPFAARAKESDVIGKELQNVFDRIRNQTAPEKNRADIAHTNAQTGYTNVQTQRGRARLPYEEQDILADIAYKQSQAHSNMQPKMGELAQAFADAERVWAQKGKNSPEGQLMAEGLQRKMQGTPGLEITQDPTTGALTVSQGGRSGAGKGAGTQLMGNQAVTPASAAQQKEQGSRQLADKVRTYLAEAAPQPFMGQGSNKELTDTALRVRKGKGSEEDKEKLVEAAVALKLVPEMALQQLNSQGVRATVSAQRHQADQLQLGWPASLKLVTDNLPKDLQQEAKSRHDEILKNAHNLQTQYHYQGTPFEMPEQAQGVPQQQIEMTFHERLQVHDALNAINSMNPGVKPFNEQDVAQSAAKLGMTPVEFAEYLKDLTMRQQNG